MRKQLGTKNRKSNEGRQANNCGVKRIDGSLEELDRETDEEQITVGRTRMADDRLPHRRERQSYVSWAGGDGEGQG